MRTQLKPFQEDAVGEFIGTLHLATNLISARPQAVVLTAPTGAGKTVMAAAAIERLLDGDEQHAAGPDVTILWITDQPDLNEQTRRKMLQHSATLETSRLVTIDTAFDQETFSPGRIYFLNTQKLAKTSTLVLTGNIRRYSLWQTIANTERARPGRFFVFIDEAHRGMNESAAAREEATTIVQRFIKGDEGLGLEQMPFIVGISATPERFDKLIAATSRSVHRVSIDATAVRASGLIKDTVILWHPTEDQPSDMTMLRAAARSWLDYTRRWAAYCAAAQEQPVQPVLAIQVQDSKGKTVSATDLDAVVAAIREELGDTIPLPDSAFAHAFEVKGPVKAKSISLRYLAPPDIEADPEVRVVFFKMSLNTGWDCPRAEVMMSFRAAKDATSIAQLVGRMVRTPLARRVEADDHLNSVALYLPHYDKAGLDHVIQQLRVADPEVLGPVDVELAENVVSVRRETGSETAFAALSEIPSYIVPALRKVVGTKRLMGLARLLANDEVAPNAISDARAHLLKAMNQAYAQLAQSGKAQAILDEKAVLDVRAVTWAVGSGVKGEITEKFAVSRENIDDLFAAAGRRLGEGLHVAYMKQRASSGVEPVTAKVEVFALVSDPTAIEAVHAAGNAHVQAWLKKYRAAIKALPESQRQSYVEIYQTGVDPQETTLTYPDTLDVRAVPSRWDRHLYVDDKGRFPAVLNQWEAAILQAELARPHVLGWLRNEPRKRWSFCIPYDLAGETRGLYPDFLFIRGREGDLVVDVVDPHRVEMIDAAPKAAGMAKFAAKHADRFGRIELVVVDDNVIRRLDLADETVRDKVKGVQTSEHLRQLFVEFGAST